MDEVSKKLIRLNLIELAEAIENQVGNLALKLHERGTISSRSKIYSIVHPDASCFEKAKKLLNLILTTKRQKTFQHLYDAVIELKLFDAAVLLKPENAAPDGYDSPEESLPEQGSWPSDDKFDVSQNFRIVESEHKEMRKLFEKSKTPEGQEIIYLMSSEKRGRVFVINNETFDTLEHRHGTSQDCIVIDTLFKQLGFDFFTKKDQIKQEMWDTLVEESNNERHVEANCFVLFLLSHGHNGVVFGTDGKMENGKPVNCIEIKKIVDLFCEKESLQGKPKLFFIEACQGGDKTYGVPVGSGDGISPGPSDKQDGPSKKDSAPMKNGGYVDNTNNPHDETNVKSTVGDSDPKPQPDQVDIQAILDDILPTNRSDSSENKRISGADCLVAMATLPGQLSWRNKAKGTWFVQAIAFVFAKWAYRYDLGKLMTRVTNLVGRAETKEGYKQQGISNFTMGNDFYFFPGLPESE
jgi:hypothetical protein